MQNERCLLVHGVSIFVPFKQPISNRYPLRFDKDKSMELRDILMNHMTQALVAHTEDNKRLDAMLHASKPSKTILSNATALLNKAVKKTL